MTKLFEIIVSKWSSQIYYKKTSSCYVQLANTVLKDVKYEVGEETPIELNAVIVGHTLAITPDKAARSDNYVVVYAKKNNRVVGKATIPIVIRKNKRAAIGIGFGLGLGLGAPALAGAITGIVYAVNANKKSGGGDTPEVPEEMTFLSLTELVDYLKVAHYPRISTVPKIDTTQTGWQELTLKFLNENFDKAIVFDSLGGYVKDFAAEMGPEEWYLVNNIHIKETVEENGSMICSSSFTYGLGEESMDFELKSEFYKNSEEKINKIILTIDGGGLVDTNEFDIDYNDPSYSIKEIENQYEYDGSQNVIGWSIKLGKGEESVYEPKKIFIPKADFGDSLTIITTHK